ncbi:TIGR03086 family metal-binding protein [Streptacidiphilus sp. EB103A]|uniref:TIGR03086 family metal-binding protein n=1 Tax=Streptacidiphilus sp. EB103A TaxID=3156275 RepID=UPI0035143F1A
MNPATSRLDRAFASTRSVLAHIRPGHLGEPTPCASWDVRAVVNHVISSAYWATASIGVGRESGDVDFGSGDFVASYDECARIALAAFGAEGVLEAAVRLPFGEFSGAELLGMAATDQFTHGWDLARAIGLPTDLDPELADELFAMTQKTVTEAYRGPDGAAPFGPELPVPAAAGPADRLAAFLGRAV